jgi:thiosulfate dehydrogenase [quinone] large subunit
MREQIWIAAVLPLRLVTGWMFLMESLGKLMNHWLDEPKLAGILEGWIRDGKPYGVYLPFLRGVVLPHAHLFSWLVVVGEMAVGAALLAGLLARPAAAAGALLVLNYMLGRGDGLAPNPTAPMLFILITLFLTRPGRTLGLDGALRGKLPQWLV